MSIIGTIYEDVTTDVLGNIGVWQWIVVVVSSSFTLPLFFNGYEDMFLIEPTKGVTCIPPEFYEVVNASLCTVTSTNNSSDHVGCTRWHVRLFWVIWLQKTWLVYCVNRMKLLSTTIICRMGLMFGCVMFGVIADSLGRRVAVIVDVVAQVVLGTVITFCDSQAWSQLLIFLKSLFGGANLYMGLILVCEISSNAWRTRLCATVLATRLLAVICLVPLANAMPNLETLSFTATLLNFLIFILLRWTPESPQWLVFNRRISVAEKILYHAANRNGIKLCSDFKIRPINHRAYNCLDVTRTCGEVLAIYNIRVIILVTLLLWSLVSFRLSYLFAKIHTENAQSVTHTLLCFFVLLSILTILVSRKLVLRHLLLFNILVSGTSAMLEILLATTTASYLFFSISLSSGLMVQTILLNITPRVFATKIRATLVGCCHAVGQVGTMIGYLLYVFQPLNNVVYVAVEIGITLVLSALCFVIFDVDGRELPDVVDDMDFFSELSKPLRWVTQKTNSPSIEELEMRIHSFGSTGGTETDGQSLDRGPARRIGVLKFWSNFTSRLK